MSSLLRCAREKQERAALDVSTISVSLLSSSRRIQSILHHHCCQSFRFLASYPGYLLTTVTSPPLTQQDNRHTIERDIQTTAASNKNNSSFCPAPYLTPFPLLSPGRLLLQIAVGVSRLLGQHIQDLDNRQHDQLLQQ